MPSHTVVIQNREPNKYSIEGINCYITYTLADIIKLEEPYYARLVKLGGLKDTCLVFAEFVTRQNFNGKLLPFLGSSATAVINPWIPVASNYIPQTGHITITTANRAKLPDLIKITLVIEIVPESWINGAKSQA